MEKSDIQRLRELPIESVAERLGLTVTRHKTLCPFHQDSHPSLSFSRSRNMFKCFVCDAHGGTIDLTMQVLGKSFIDACQWLAGENSTTRNLDTSKLPNFRNSEIPKYPPDVDYLRTLMRYPVLNEPARHFLFDERRLNPKVISWCGISSISYPTPCWRYGRPFYDAPSLLFPYKDINGRVMNVQSRYLGNAEVPRFRFPPNGDIHIFNLPILRYLHDGEPLYISEGITDCLALLSSGHKAIAIPSATLLKADDLKLLSSFNSQLSTIYHIYPDKDDAGERMYRQLLNIANDIGTCIVRHDLPDGCKDYSDFYIRKLTIDN